MSPHPRRQQSPSQVKHDLDLASILIFFLVSIVGIIAVSVYSLYLEDKLLTRVRSLELNLGKVVESEKVEETKQSVGNGVGPKQTETKVDPPASDDRVQSLIDGLTAERTRLETIERELAANTARINVLGDVQKETNQRMDSSSWSDAETSKKIELLRKDVTELKKQLENVEKESEEIASRIDYFEEL